MRIKTKGKVGGYRPTHRIQRIGDSRQLTHREYLNIGARLCPNQTRFARNAPLSLSDLGGVAGKLGRFIGGREMAYSMTYNIFKKLTTRQKNYFKEDGIFRIFDIDATVFDRGETARNPYNFYLKDKSYHKLTIYEYDEIKGKKTKYLAYVIFLKKKANPLGFQARDLTGRTPQKYRFPWGFTSQ